MTKPTSATRHGRRKITKKRDIYLWHVLCHVSAMLQVNAYQGQWDIKPVFDVGKYLPTGICAPMDRKSVASGAPTGPLLLSFPNWGDRIPGGRPEVSVMAVVNKELRPVRGLKDDCVGMLYALKRARFRNVEPGPRAFTQQQLYKLNPQTLCNLHQLRHKTRLTGILITGMSLAALPLPPRSSQKPYYGRTVGGGGLGMAGHRDFCLQA